MNKIITAKDILKQKGYVQNKFDTNGFIQVVADMFGDLPVEGILHLYCVRFVEKDFPLTKEENSRGYYYLTDENKKIQNEFATLKKKYDESINTTEAFSPKIGKICDEIEKKMRKQMDLPRKHLIDKVDKCPEEYQPALSYVSDEIALLLYGVNCTPDLLYSVLKKYYAKADILLNRLVKRYDKYHALEKAQEELEKKVNDYASKYDPILQLKPNSVYIDDPFFTNAASVLRTMCGYVVERKVRKGQKMYDVKLV